MQFRKRSIVQFMAASALLIAGAADAAAASASSHGSKSKPAKTASRPSSFTPGMWAAAAPLYRKNLDRLMQTRAGAQAPRPRLNANPGPAGNQPLAIPASQPKNVRTGSGWSMTATRGERNSIVSSRTYSSGSMSNTSSSASSGSASSASSSGSSSN